MTILKLFYFGHIMKRFSSLEKSLEVKQKRMTSTRWSNSVTVAMDALFEDLKDQVKDCLSQRKSARSLRVDSNLMAHTVIK